MTDPDLLAALRAASPADLARIVADLPEAAVRVLLDALSPTPSTPADVFETLRLLHPDDLPWAVGALSDEAAIAVWRHLEEP